LRCRFVRQIGKIESAGSAEVPHKAGGINFMRRWIAHQFFVLLALLFIDAGFLCQTLLVAIAATCPFR
jgi:hypothetical protein